MDQDSRRPARPVDRRAFLLTGVGLFLAGCTESTRTADWEPQPVPPAPHYDPPVARGPSAPATTPAPGPGPGVISRTKWASGAPVPTLMDRMKPVRYITVHHDGMEPFYGNSTGATASRLDAIRRAHRGMPQPWGDIGYHFAVDRSGRVWACRPVTYQGAHVKNHNEGNIGIVCLGNFERQSPTPAQLQGLRVQLSVLMARYNVSSRNVRTHREWAPTLCPGRQLQPHVVTFRQGGRLA